MSALDEPPSTTDTARTPCDTDKEPLLWTDGNYARIPGLLLEFGKWTVRQALLQPWYQHRAVLVGRMTYVENKDLRIYELVVRFDLGQQLIPFPS